MSVSAQRTDSHRVIRVLIQSRQLESVAGGRQCGERTVNGAFVLQLDAGGTLTCSEMEQCGGIRDVRHRHVRAVASFRDALAREAQVVAKTNPVTASRIGE